MGNYKVGEFNLLQLVSTVSTHATDPRDRIFALIGPAGDRTYGTVPNYNKSEAEVFAEFACAVIRTENNLDVLKDSYVENPECPERLPLWAPRWHFDDYSRNLCLNNYNFTASRDAPTMLGPPLKSMVLSLRGLQVDLIRDMRDRTADIKRDFVATIDMITSNFKVFNKRYGPGIIRTVLLTMMAGQEKSGPMMSQKIRRPTDDQYLRDFIAFFLLSTVRVYMEGGRESDQRKYLELVRLAAEAILLPVEPCWELREDFELIERMLTALYPHDSQVVLADLDMLSRIDSGFVKGFGRFEEAILASGGSRMFTTETGYVGFGPPCMRHGDVMCVLLGGKTPYIIRPTAAADEYSFLGIAYVHELMDGEAIDAWEKGERTENQEIQDRLFKLL